VKCE